MSFLLAHVAYISAFYIDLRLNPPVNKMLMIGSFLVFGLYCFGFYNYLSPHLGELIIPVLCYAVIISAMAICASLRYKKVNNVSYIMILVGALFFLASDSALGINKFAMQFDHGEIIIMATYMLAQYYITVGAVNRAKSI